MPKPVFEIPNSNTTPPGGWSYAHPMAEKPFTHYDHSSWIASIQSFFEGNNIPMPPDWVERVHDEACKQNPHWKSRCRRVVDKQIKRRPVNFATIMQFLKSLTKWLSDGGQLESQEEANRRSLICSQCPYAFPAAQGCGSCTSAIMGLIEKLIGQRKSEPALPNKTCGICGCSLSASVWFPLESQHFGLSDEMKEEFKQVTYCWKNENL